MEKVFGLPEVNIEILVPKFLAALESSKSEYAIFNLTIHLLKTDVVHAQIESVYRFLVSIAYILQTGKKDQSDFKIATIKIPNEKTAIHLFDALLEYLFGHSVSLADRFEMKSIVAIQLFGYFEHAKLTSN